MTIGTSNRRYGLSENLVVAQLGGDGTVQRSASPVSTVRLNRERSCSNAIRSGARAASRFPSNGWICAAVPVGENILGFGERLSDELPRLCSPSVHRLYDARPGPSRAECHSESRRHAARCRGRERRLEGATTLPIARKSIRDVDPSYPGRAGRSSRTFLGQREQARDRMIVVYMLSDVAEGIECLARGERDEPAMDR